MFLAKVTLFLSFGSQWERLKVEKDMGMDLKLMLQTAEFSSDVIKSGATHCQNLAQLLLGISFAIVNI